MCGIAGAVWTENSKAVDTSTLHRMTDALIHRGPDEQGHYFQELDGGGVALGHRRLSIIGLDSGCQPISNEDGTIQIVFNGEIYNYRELREQLIRAGHQFKTETDTEVIVHLYEDKGEQCVDDLRGMFAFAIWDERSRQLFLARDRLGQKPLCYKHENDRLIFASELKAILQVPGIEKRIAPTALDSFLTYQYVPYPESILAGFSKLPPAHFAMFRNGELKTRRYWNPPFADLARQTSTLEDNASQLRELVEESVRLRMRSDVPVGAFLSGGVDSTIIAGVMQQLVDHPVHTFSIGFDEPRFDERSFARMAAEKLGTEHHEFVVRPNALESLGKLSWHYDEPFADSSAIPMMHLSEVTRPIVKVALSGDGGDELFAGYDRYRAVQLASRFDGVPQAVRAAISATAGFVPASIHQRTRLRRLKRFLSELKERPIDRYGKWISIFPTELRQNLYTDDFAESLSGHDAYNFLKRAYEECSERDFVTRTSAADVLTYLPCDILTKVDIASMAYGLECRSPFLDHSVVEFAARLPVEQKRDGSNGKTILKHAFRDLLLDEISSRPKMGFGVPLDHWFRSELRDFVLETLTSQSFQERGYFRPEAIRRLIEEHVQSKKDHAARLWALIVLEFWHQTFLDRDISMAQSA